MAIRIDAFRVATDAAYAAGLSAAEWNELAQSHEWLQLVAEQRELVANVLDVHGHMLPGFMAQVQPPVSAPHTASAAITSSSSRNTSASTNQPRPGGTLTQRA